MALDYWYELWENTASRGGSTLDQHSDKEDRYYPLKKDYLTWTKDEEAGDGSR